MDNNASSAQAQPKKRKHKLEIQIYEADWEKADANNGQPLWRPVRSDPALDGGKPNIIEVADKAELAEMQKQFALCDQRIKVIREIDPFDDGEQLDSKKKVGIPPDNQAIPVDATAKSPAMQDSPQMPSQKTMSRLLDSQAAIVKPKPKIVMIGDIEVKYDGDKVYQKQWMKLTPAEASNFRVVADATNKIVNLNGKHIEAKRWTLIEEKPASQDDSVESLIEG